MCGGCGHWVLMGTHDGKRYGAPYDAERGVIVPWAGKPTDAAVEAEKAAMLGWLGPVVVAGALGEALEAIGC
jgi:hypothetical protein